MRAITAVLAATLLIGCQADETPPAETPAAEVPAPAPALTLADFAGTWQNSATLEGVADPVQSTLRGGPDGTDWTTSFEGRPDIPTTAMIVGDSLITETAEYESVLRPGVMVTVRSASVLQDGMMHGNFVARYRTPDGEEVVNGTLMATRVQ
ncbi:MAG TPA: hypothetical protein VK928_00845 [Longimicrobiales bacterium]|nr:hypothetical protein [Longimicrobiales bacterium]